MAGGTPIIPSTIGTLDLVPHERNRSQGSGGIVFTALSVPNQFTGKELFTARLVTDLNIALDGSLVTCDGVSIVDGDLIVPAGQTDAKENGLYKAYLGSAYVRYGSIYPGALISILEGIKYQNTEWMVNSDTINFGVTDILISRPKLSSKDNEFNQFFNALTPIKNPDLFIIEDSTSSLYTKKKVDYVSVKNQIYADLITDIFDYVESQLDYKVKVAADGTAGYLTDKIVVVDDIFKNVLTTSGKQIELGSYGRIKNQASDIFGYLPYKLVTDGNNLTLTLEERPPASGNYVLVADSSDKYVAINGVDIISDEQGEYLQDKLTASKGIQHEELDTGVGVLKMDTQLYNFAGLTPVTLTTLSNPIIAVQDNAVSLTDIKKMNFLDMQWCEIGTDYAESIVGKRHTITIPQTNRFPFTGYYHYAIDISISALWNIIQPTFPLDTFAFGTIGVTVTDADGAKVLEQTPIETFTIGQKGGCVTPCCCTVEGDYQAGWLHINGYAHITANTALTVTINFPPNVTTHTVNNIYWGFNYLCQTLGIWYS